LGIDITPSVVMSLGLNAVELSMVHVCEYHSKNAPLCIQISVQLI
jgi:hypothetical protein